jgi:hypothetical protein
MKYAHSCLTLTALVAFPSLALAQNIQGAFQLGLGTSLVNYSKDSLDIQTPVTDTNIDNSRTNWGFNEKNGVALEGGYGLTDSLVFGGLVNLGGNSETMDWGTDQATTSTFNLFLAPKLDYLFMPGSTLRPFIGGALGLSVQTMDSPDSFLGNTNTSLWGLGLLARVGVKWFAAPGFSLDPSFNFGGRWLTGSTDVGNANYDTSSSGFQVGLSLGMSGWIK